MALSARTLISFVSLVAGGLLADFGSATGAAPSWHRFEPRTSVADRWQVSSLLDDAGLPGRFVFCIDFDRDGNAWIASAEGLVVYDGYEWRRITQADGLPTNFVRSVLVAQDGTVWVGTKKGVATIAPSGDISVLPDADLAGPNVRRIVQDSDGTLWFCSDTWLTPGLPSGLASLRDGVWTVYRKKDGLPGDYVGDYFQDSAGRRYALCRNGLAVMEDGTWIRPLEAAEIPNHGDYFWSIAESEKDGVVITTDNAVFVFKGGRWARHEYPNSRIRALRVTSLGSGYIVALSTGYGIAKQFLRWTESGFVPITDTLDVRGEASFLSVAPDDSVWASGYDLLVRWAPSRGEWTRYSGLSEPNLLDGSGRVWFTCDRGVARVTPQDEWEYFPCDARALSRASGGDVIGLEHDGVLRFSTDGVIRYAAEETRVRTAVGHMLDDTGRSWLYGLDAQDAPVASVYDGHKWRSWTLADVKRARIQAAADRAGGVYYLIADRANEFQRLYRADGLGVEAIDLPTAVVGTQTYVHVSYRGEPWVYGHFGLYGRSDGSWRRIEGAPGERVAGAANGVAETWITYDGTAGGRTGVGRLRGRTWQYMNLPVRPAICARKPNAPILFQTPGSVFGNLGESMESMWSLTLPVDRPIRTVVEKSPSDMWLGLGDMVLRYRADGVPPDTAIVAADAEVKEGDSLKVHVSGVERFKARGERPLNYSWRIQPGPWSGFDKAQDLALGDSLAPGTHTLEVRARDEGLDVDPTPAHVRFVVTPIPLAERPWFRSVLGLSFSGLAMLVALLLTARRRTKRDALRLEQLVEHGTAELRATNEQLRRRTAEREAAEEQLSRQREELAHLERLDTAAEMVTGMTHELGQPLAVILSGAEACARLLRDGGTTKEELVKTLDRIATQAERAGAVVNSFKRFIRRQEPEYSLIDLNAVVRDAVEMARLEAKGLEAAVHLDLAESLASPRGVPVQIMQVTLNLVRNALEAVAACDPRARDVTVRTSMLNGSGVSVTVSDTGVGPGAAPIERMFSPFYSTKPDGMGIGLSLSRSIAEAHGGRLHARPNRDRGMTFVLTLPAGG